MLSLWIILLFIAVLAMYLIQKRASAHPLPPAYPGALPIIGHTHLLLRNGQRLWTLIKEVSDYCVKEGGVITGQLGMDNFYMITDPEDALTVSNTCLMRKHYLYSLLTGFIGDGLLTFSDEKKWKHHRKMLTPAFSVKNTHSFICNFNQKSRKLVAQIDEICDKGPIDMSRLFKALSMETALTSMFGSKLINEEQTYHKYAKAIDDFLEIILERFKKAWLHFDCIYKLFGYEKQDEQIKTVLNDIFEKALKIKKANEGSISALTLDDRFRSFLELFLQAPNSDSLTDEEIKTEVNHTITAAHDTSSNQILIIVYYIATHPEVQEQVYQEVIKFVGEDRDIEKEDLPNLKYTEAVVKEALRILPTVPIVIRYTEKDVKLKNYTVSAGTFIALSLYGVNHHPDWVDPHQFRPERWLHPDTLPANSNTFATFSMGKRNCLGKLYAMTSLTILVAHIVRAYRLTAASDNMKFSYEMTLKSATRFEISLQRRTKRIINRTADPIDIVLPKIL